MLLNFNKKINLFLYIYNKYNILFSLVLFLIFTLILIKLGFIDNAHKWLDGQEYIARSQNISFIDLNLLGLRDGFRPPLFPILLHLISFLPFDIVIFYKVLNIFFVFFISSIIIFLTKKITITAYKNIFTLTALLLYFFLPNFFFIDFVYAELLTVFIFNIQIFLIYKIYFLNSYNFKNLSILSILFVISFYLKANLILFGIIFLIFVNKIFSNFKYFFYFGSLIFIFLTPWFLYMFSITGTFKATNSQYVNRLQGMGLDTIGHGLNNLDTLHGKYIYKVYGNNDKIKNYYTLYFRHLDEKYLAYDIHGMDLELQLIREKYSKISIEKIFKHDPIVQIKYSLLKIPHLFGFSFRDARDYVISIYSTFSFLLMIFFFIKKKYVVFVYLNFLVLISTIIQTFMYVPTLRYSIYFFNSSIILYSAFIYNYLIMLKK